jgi:hypothetical protein
MVHWAQTVLLSCTDTYTVSKQKKEIPHDWHHLGVPLGASEMISEPMVCSMQTVHLSCIKISTISKWTELSLEPRHLRVPSGASKTISRPMVRSTQTVHLSYVKISTISKLAEHSLGPHHLGVPSVCPKQFLSRLYIWRRLCTYLAPTLTLSLNGKKGDSTWPTSPRSFVHRVRPKQFLSLSYVRRTPCTYLTSRLALSPYGPSFHLSLFT